jgi:hypothetical protein
MLQLLPNVKLHGAVNTAVLSEGLKQMDALLICYSAFHREGVVRNDHNHHKVLEYLGTGNVIVSTYLTAYADKQPQVIEMIPDRDTNEKLPALFDQVINNLHVYNSLEKKKLRSDFAKQYTYPNQIKRIEYLINNLQ